MNKDIPIFVYGELKPEVRGKPASAHGELRLRHDGDAAAKFGLEYDTTVKGKLTHITAQRLAMWDKMEKPEYARKKVLLTDNAVVYAYEYTGTAWEHFKVVPDGNWVEEYED